MVELVFLGKVGEHRAAARPCLGLELGQAVIGLRADHEVDEGRPGDDFLALGLGDAARDPDPEVGVRRLKGFQPAKL